MAYRKSRFFKLVDDRIELTVGNSQRIRKVIERLLRQIAYTVKRSLKPPDDDFGIRIITVDDKLVIQAIAFDNVNVVKSTQINELAKIF